MNENLYVVNGKQRWNMKDDNGNEVKGSRIFIDSGDELVQGSDKEGKFDTIVNLPYDSYEMFKHVPGLYELDIQMKVGSKAQFTVKGVRYAGETEKATQK